MSIDASAINSPLALIALFVAIIELFLIFPIAKLEGKDRSRLVLFIIAYPIFIACAFFLFLWFKPVHLYTPKELSEELQSALLPESLNRELAPERATMVALEYKLGNLEASLKEISRKVGDNTRKVENAKSAEVVYRDEIERLRKELLERVKKSGDLSRENLASIASEIKTESEKLIEQRSTKAREELQKFRNWAIGKGLSDAPPVPQVENVEDPWGPFGDADYVTLGPPDFDYLVPALYLNSIAGLENVPYYQSEDANQFFYWAILEYLAGRFAGLPFPVRPEDYGLENPVVPMSSTQKIKMEMLSVNYSENFRLFNLLITEFGHPALEKGIIYMVNNWGPKTDFNESLDLMFRGIVETGVATEQITAFVERYGVKTSD